MPNHEFGIRLLYCSKLVINRKNDNDIIVCQHDIIVNFFDVFWRCCIFRVEFHSGPSVIPNCYWFWSYHNFGNVSSEFCLISRDLGRVRDTRFGMNASNEMLLNTAKCQGYNFYLLWVTFIWGKTNREAKYPATSRLGLAFFMSGSILYARTEKLHFSLESDWFPLWPDITHIARNSYFVWNNFQRHRVDTWMI